MAKVFAAMRLIAGALALAFVVATAIPVAAQQPNSVNPNAAAVQEQQLLQQLKMIEGRGTIPDVKSYVLEHPAGREWREFRTVTLAWIGGIAILGMLALLAIYYLWHGALHIEGGRSGRTISEIVGTETPSGAARSVRFRICPQRLARSERKRRKVAKSRMELTARTSLSK